MLAHEGTALTSHDSPIGSSSATIPFQGLNLRPPQMTGYRLGWKSKGYIGCIDWGLSMVDKKVEL